MKYRLDFVTNSSSSCYVCDICGNAESGMDLCLSEAEMCECKAGHVFCEAHMTVCIDDNDNTEDVKSLLIELIHEKIKEYDTGYTWLTSKEKADHITEEKKLLEQVINNEFDVETMSEMNRDDYELRYHVPTKYCPICNFTELEDSTALQFMLKLFNTTEEELIKMIEEKFGTYQEFIKFIHGSK